MKTQSSSDRGAVAILVAISLLVLLGMAAIAIDGGSAYNERRSTQGAADHAALAAAWAACNAQGESAAVAAGSAAAASNGYDGGQANIDVTITRLAGTTSSYEAVVTSTEGTQFGGVIGQDEVTVASRAVADCTRNIWGGGYALFAAGPPACSNTFELDFTGGGVTVDGQVHSNGDLRINGNNGNPSTITGLTTYVEHPPAYNGVQFDGGLDQTTTQPNPFDIEFSRYIPANNTARWGVDYFHHPSGGTINDKWLQDVPGNDKSGGVSIINRSGVYFTTGEIKNVTIQMGTDPSTGQTARATFVAGGSISLNGESSVTHYDPNGVVLFSNHQPPGNCNNKAIKWSSSAGLWTGLVYAPHGEVEMSMAGGQGIDGAIYGYAIDLSGSDYTINYEDVTNGAPEFQLEFTE